MSSNPLVSVLICTYNASKFIDNTMASVREQTYENIEILVLDNNSSDDTVSKLQTHRDHDERVTLYQEDENLGAYSGLNYLLERTSGGYIAIQDHDDIWHPQKINLQISFLESNPEYVGCGGLPVKFYEGKDKIYIESIQAEDSFSPHPSLVFRYGDYRYDTSLDYKTDTYFMRRILCDGEPKLYNIQKPLYISLVRKDQQNLSTQWVNFRNVLEYSWRIKTPRPLFRQLYHLFHPSKPYPANHIDNIWENKELEDVRSLRDNEFTNEFMKYIDNCLTATDSDIANSDSTHTQQ